MVAFSANGRIIEVTLPATRPKVNLPDASNRKTNLSERAPLFSFRTVSNIYSFLHTKLVLHSCAGALQEREIRSPATRRQVELYPGSVLGDGGSGEHLPQTTLLVINSQARPLGRRPYCTCWLHISWRTRINLDHDSWRLIIVISN